MTKNWEKEFDEKFPITKGLAGYEDHDIVGSARKHQWVSLSEEIKSFIESLLAAKEQEFVEKLEGLKMHEPQRSSVEFPVICRFNDNIDSLLQEYKQGRPNQE